MPEAGECGRIVGRRRREQILQYRKLCADELCRDLFASFTRRQNVTKCWRKEENQWVIRDVPFIDDWTDGDYEFLVKCLKHTIASGGVVYGAFADGRLKGFASVEPGLFGEEHNYLDLSSIHVSEDLRGAGIGKCLFAAAKEWAREQGARKLYISAHSSVETQAFYKAMGCVEAKWQHPGHVEQEPFDCQLECVL